MPTEGLIMNHREEIRHIKNLLNLKSSILLNNIHKSIVGRLNKTDCVIKSDKINDQSIDINIVVSEDNLNKIKDEIINIRNNYNQ